ncbi:Vps52-domain-containing protein [Aureobasidium sp. EXF-10727]|nr:Vps52-domain-containing protein [Aureobasidium sp. EXF-10727]
MWLNRYSQHPSPSSSPAPQRRPSHLAPGPLPHRPAIANRSSSLSLLTNGSTDSLPAAARYPPAHSNLRNQLDASPVDHVSHPLDVLRDILAPVHSEPIFPDAPDLHGADIDFGELSLQEFADAAPSSDQPSEQPSVEEFEKDKGKFDDLHQSIVACDEVLKSVENYLTSFQADLAAVSAEIETLQNRSSALNTKLETRKRVEKLLAPEVDILIISPSIVRKISDGPIDDAWIKALEDLEKRSKIIDSKASRSKSAAELKPLIDSLKNKAVERTRDYVVSQIKALRAPGVNAQLLQQNNFMRYKDAFQFLDRHQPQLGQEIGRAYINTMRWFYLHNFSRYKASLDKMNIHVVDKNEVLAQDDTTKRTTAVSGSRTQAAPHDAFSLGRRMDMLKGSFKSALSSHIAEEDKSAYYLEAPFRAFNLALMDNASGEYSFLTGFFSKQSYHEVNRKFAEIFQPTFALGQALTKQLIDPTVDALGLLITVRLNQHFAFELQRRKVPAMEGYVNGTNMLLWPRFQMVMDAHCESLRKATSSLSGRPAGSALTLTSASAPQSIAPHQITQRFANFTQGILALSSEAGDDEPVQNSLGRLRNDFEAFLTKLSKSFAEQKKRDRFLANNYSLVGTIIAETEGKMAEELKAHFGEKAEEFGGR